MKKEVKNLPVFLSFSAEAGNELHKIASVGKFPHILPDMAEILDKVALLDPHGALSGLLEQMEMEVRKKIQPCSKALTALSGMPGDALELPQFFSHKGYHPIGLANIQGAKNDGFTTNWRNGITLLIIFPLSNRPGNYIVRLAYNGPYDKKGRKI